MSHIPADHVSAAKKKDIACVNITKVISSFFSHRRFRL